MADVPSPSPSLPELGAPSADARLAMALHALGDLREQLQGAQRSLAGTIAELEGSLDLPDDLAPSTREG
jgi:hypothetical protein